MILQFSSPWNRAKVVHSVTLKRVFRSLRAFLGGGFFWVLVLWQVMAGNGRLSAGYRMQQNTKRSKADGQQNSTSSVQRLRRIALQEALVTRSLTERVLWANGRRAGTTEPGRESSMEGERRGGGSEETREV